MTTKDTATQGNDGSSDPWKAFTDKYLHKYTKIDLGEIGLPEFWVEVKEYRSLTPLELLDRSQNVKLPKEVVRLIEAGAYILSLDEISSIVRWNLTSKIDGHPLKLPKDDPEELRHLPYEVLFFIKEKLYTINVEELIPKKLKSTSLLGFLRE